MKKLRVLKSALRAICRNPTRTFLTTLGIVIGIAAVIALMEIGNGAQEMLSKNMEAMGVNTINIWPGNITRGGVSSGSGARANLTLKDVDAIRKNCENVTAVSPIVTVRGQIIYGGKNWSPYRITGGSEEFLTISNWVVEDGEPFTARDVRRGARVCLIGSTIARELFEDENPVGKKLRIQNVMFTIVGVLKGKGANMMGMDQDDCVIVPYTAARARLKGAGQTSLSAVSSVNAATTASTTTASSTYTGGVSLYPPVSDANKPPVRFSNVDSIIASASSPESVPSAVLEIGNSIRETHKLSIDNDDDFRIRTMAEFSDFLSSQIRTTTRLLMCVAFVSLVVGGVGIMNIMLVSVTERTREIGLRMAVGARERDILRQFLVESVVICLVGGVIGIFAGHGLSLALAGAMKWPILISYPAIFLSVGVSALVGVVFGYYPAWKAAQLDPIEALRYE